MGFTLGAAKYFLRILWRGPFLETRIPSVSKSSRVNSPPPPLKLEFIMVSSVEHETWFRVSPG